LVFLSTILSPYDHILFRVYKGLVEVNSIYNKVVHEP